MKSVAIHEILHFIYFEKWKKVFPKTQEKEFDAPHLVWQLSEMVPGIILNDKRVQNVFKYKFDSYKEYENFKKKMLKTSSNRVYTTWWNASGIVCVPLNQF